MKSEKMQHEQEPDARLSGPIGGFFRDGEAPGARSGVIPDG